MTIMSYNKDDDESDYSDDGVMDSDEEVRKLIIIII